MSRARGIRSPRDLQALPAEPAAGARCGDPRRARREGDPHRRPPRTQPRRRRAHDRPAPGVPLAATTSSSSTPGTSPTCTRCSPAGSTTSTTLRQEGGLSGYPSRSESEHDVVENSHASTALSWADGIAKGFERTGDAGAPARRRRSSATARSPAVWRGRRSTTSPPRPTARSSWWSTTTSARTRRPSAGSRTHLATLRTARSYERVLDWGKRVLGRTPVVGSADLRDPARGQEGHQGRRRPAGHVRGPRAQVHRPGRRPRHRRARARAQSRQGRSPARCIVHVITEKGRGYLPAELDDAERFHAVGILDPETGQPLGAQGRARGPRSSPTSSSRSGARRPDVVAVTAAMMGPTGLDRVLRRVPRPHLRRRHRRAARRHERRRDGVRRSAPGGRALRDVRQPRLRPGAHGLSRCTGPASRSCSTAPASPATTAPATTACGTCPMLRRRPRAAHRGAARRRDAARGAGRGRRGRRRADRRALPEGRRRAGRPGARADRRRRRAAPRRRARRCCWSRSAPSRRCASRWPTGSRRRAIGGHRRRPALGGPGADRGRRSRPRAPGWWSASRTTAALVGVGSAVAPALRDARGRRARSATSASTRRSCTTRRVRRCSRRSDSPPRTSRAASSRPSRGSTTPPAARSTTRSTRLTRLTRRVPPTSRSTAPATPSSSGLPPAAPRAPRPGARRRCRPGRGRRPPNVAGS